MNNYIGLHLEKETYEITGAAMDVLNTLGSGFREKSYENSLVVEFELRNIPFLQQPVYPMIYKGQKVDNFIPDIVTHNQIIVDTKVIPKITNLEKGQIINYLKITNLKVGLILNFKNHKLEWQRVIL